MSDDRCAIELEHRRAEIDAQRVQLGRMVRSYGARLFLRFTPETFKLMDELMSSTGEPTGRALNVGRKRPTGTRC